MATFIRSSYSYARHEPILVAPPYLGSGRYEQSEPRQAYVLGTAGPHDVKVTYEPNGREWQEIVHLQRVIGSGVCHWEAEQAKRGAQ